MLRRFLHGRVDRLADSFGYDATYLHEIIDVSPAAFFKFALFQVMADHCKGVPRDAWYAAKLAAAISEDCGPCTQLVVDMALREGVAPVALAALLRGDFAAAGKDAELGFRYGIAIAKNTENVLTLVEEVAKRFGKRALVSLDFAVACSRVYPTLKRGLGHGAACLRIKVSNETIVLREAA